MYKLKVKGLHKAQKAIRVEGFNMEKLDLFLERMAETFKDEAEVHFSKASISEWSLGVEYEWTPPIYVTVEKIDNGYAVLAEGYHVAFIEFGAGVFYNGSDSYKGRRPKEIARIGEYGKGRGKQNAWGFYREGDLVITRGNPPANAMYFGLEAVQNKIQEIAEEVFK